MYAGRICDTTIAGNPKSREIFGTAAPSRIPQPLIEQLRVGGRLVIPVGEVDQELQVIVKTGQGLQTQRVIPVRFVPMTGEVER